MTKQHEKYANELEKALAQFSENVNKIVTEMFSFEGKKEKDWKMKSSGDVFSGRWDNIEADNKYLSQGNIFPTEQAAELEAKRRNLLTRFRAFRDECNGDWEPDWESNNDRKHYILFSSKGELETYSTGVCNDFQLFGFFKNKEDAERAIELFGDEIEELFVEV